MLSNETDEEYKELYKERKIGPFEPLLFFLNDQL